MQNLAKTTLKTMTEDKAVAQNDKTNSNRLALILARIGTALNMKQLVNYK